MIDSGRQPDLESPGAPEEPRSPGDGLLLVGHSWTRRSVARHIGATPAEVVANPHLLRIDSPVSYEEAYPAFQFDEQGIRVDVAVTGLLIRRRVPDDLACDWFFRPNPAASGASPLAWLDNGGTLDRLLEGLPTPARPLPGAPRADDGIADQVEAWIRQSERSRARVAGAGRAEDRWRAFRERSEGAEATPAVKELIRALIRSHG